MGLIFRFQNQLIFNFFQNPAEIPFNFFYCNFHFHVLKVDPEEKLITKEKCEKHFLRSMYKDILPEEVVWRTKAMQCEGVGMTWVQTLQDHIDKNLVSDEDFSNATKRLFKFQDISNAQGVDYFTLVFNS